MPLYSESIVDPRVREYLPATRLVWSSGLQNGERWIGCREYQVFMGGTPDFPVLEPGGAVVLDFGIELHGGIRLVNYGGAGRIRLRFGESVSEAMGCPDQTHAIHDAELDVPCCGALEYGTTAFRFVRVDHAGGGELVIMNVLAVSLGRELEYAGAFESSDERLNRIWKTGAYTVHLNMQEYLFDGAKRDRAVWIGDMHPEARCILAAFRDTSIIPASLDFHLRHTPFPEVGRRITTYACWSVIIMRDYWRATGDLNWVAGHRDYLLELLRIYVGYVGEDGAECVPERRFLDWPSSRDPVAKHAGIQGLMRWMMLAATELFEALGEDSGFIRRAADRLAGHVPQCNSSKAAAALLTLGGIADRRDIIETDPLCGVSAFYGYYLLLAKPTRSALELIRRYWGAMLDLGATTFWEDFDLSWCGNALPITELPRPGRADIHAGFGDFCYRGVRRSLCHGWSCGPTPFLSERVLGVRLLTPGGGRIEVRPDLGDLEYVRGRVPTPHGVVTVAAECSGEVRVEVPDEVEVVGVPGLTAELQH